VGQVKEEEMKRDVWQFGVATAIAIIIATLGSVAVNLHDRNLRLDRENFALSQGLDKRDAEGYAATWEVYGEDRADEYMNYVFITRSVK
jgi:hypothetical protein